MRDVDRSTELKLPTIAVPARLAVEGHHVSSAELFVADIPRSGRLQLLDDVAALLDAEASFVPIRVSGQVRLMAKRAICWVAIARREADEPMEETLYDRKHLVAVELAAGSQVIGTFLDNSPSDFPRVIDYLNRTREFVRLWTSGEHYLINKAQIVGVTELPESTEA